MGALMSRQRQTVASRLRDRFLLFVTALGVGALLLLAGFTFGDRLSRPAMLGVLFFGSIAFIEGEEIRRTRTRLRHWWPLAVAWLIFLLASMLMLGWLTLRFSLKWRMVDTAVAMLIGFWIWEFVRERVFKY